MEPPIFATCRCICNHFRDFCQILMRKAKVFAKIRKRKLLFQLNCSCQFSIHSRTIPYVTFIFFNRKISIFCLFLKIFLEGGVVVSVLTITQVSYCISIVNVPLRGAIGDSKKRLPVPAFNFLMFVASPACCCIVHTISVANS
jgi:hypothetical protein